MSLFSELKRRNVFRVAAAYVVISWLLIQVIGLAAESFSAPEWVMKMIIVVLLIGFIPTLFFSWAFELTPEGLKKESEISNVKSITSHTAKKLDVITLIAVVLIAGLIAIDRFFPESTTRVQNNDNVVVEETSNTDSKTQINNISTISDNSIAVLPFSDLSQKGDQEYFSDGMAEEILNVLVRVETLEVASRTSAFQFKGMDIGIPEIAKKLQVRHILEGSVRKSGKTIRITAQLIDAENDKHLWSNTYDRPLNTENIFAIQDEISQAIVTALSKKLGLKSIVPINVSQVTESLNAYELYLKARPLFLSRISLVKADNYLTEAIGIDPNFAKAWEMKSAMQILFPSYDYTEFTQEELDARTEEYAQKALTLEPNSALALSSLAFMRQNSTFQLRKIYPVKNIMEAFDKAIQIDPFNPTSYNWRGLGYMAIGNLEAGLEDFKKCQSIEKNYLPCISNIIEVYAELGNDQEAVILLEEALNKSLVQANNINLGLLARNNKPIAFKLVTNDRRLLFGFKRHQQLYQAFKNPEQDHKELIQDIIDFIAKDSKILKVNLYGTLIPIGGFDIEQFISFIWGEENIRYRQSGQFKNYIHKSGILNYWKETTFPPQCRPLGEDDFECD